MYSSALSSSTSKLDRSCEKKKASRANRIEEKEKLNDVVCRDYESMLSPRGPLAKRAHENLRQQIATHKIHAESLLFTPTYWVFDDSVQENPEDVTVRQAATVLREAY